MIDDRPILITGASGFVGARIAESLFLRGPAPPKAGVRDWSRAARIARCPMEIVLCDIMDAGRMNEAAEGVQAVVHCAYSDDRDSIVEGTRNVLQAALSRGARRFVFLSTAEVYGPGVEGPVEETAPRPRTGSVYGDAKIEAEDLCWEFHRKGLPVTILRPSLVYGPFGKSWTIDIAKRLQSGNWGLFEEYGEGFCNLVYVDDLVSAVRLAIEHPSAPGEAFNVNGPETGTWNEYFQRFNEALGLPPLARVSSGRTRLRAGVMDQCGSVARFVVGGFREPLMRVYLRGGLMSKIMASVKRKLDTTPSRGELKNLFSRGAIYVPHKAHEMLGYRPAFRLDDGLRTTVAWLRHHGFSDGLADGVLDCQAGTEPDAFAEASTAPDRAPSGSNL